MRSAQLPDSSPADPKAALPPKKTWRSTTLLWVMLAGLLLWSHWPVAKALYYRATDQTAVADGIAWQTDYSNALVESARTGKPVLLDFSAAWCPYCQIMQHDVWPDPRVRDLVNSKYIPVALDADNSATVGPAQKYNVETIPRILVVDARGNVLKDGSYMNVDELIQFLSQSKRF